MYTSKTITRPDGSKYVQCIWETSIAQEWSDDQEHTARAIEAFGTSA